MKLTYQQQNLLSAYIQNCENNGSALGGSTIEEKVQFIMESNGYHLTKIFSYLPFDTQIETVTDQHSLVRLLTHSKHDLGKYNQIRASIKDNFVSLDSRHQFYVMCEVPEYDLVILAVTASDLSLRWFFLQFPEKFALHPDYKKIEKRLIGLINTFKSVEDSERDVFVELLLKYATSKRISTRLKLIL